MLTRIEIDGFKSLQNFSLDLEPFMAIVGTNGAGKSNLFEAMALLSRLVSMPVREALKGGRGHTRDQFSLTKNGHADKISFAVELLLPNRTTLFSSEHVELTHTRARYELVLERRTQAPNEIEETLITRELLRPIQQDEDSWATKHHAEMLYGETRPILSVNNPASIEREARYSSFYPSWGMPFSFLDHSSSRALSESELPATAIIFTTHREIQSFRFSQVEPSQLRGASETADATTLARDGSNLPTVFAALPVEAQARVRANLIRFIPGLRDVEVKQRDDEFLLEATSLDGRRFPARILSDGTLRILALLVLLESSPKGSLLAIEELENGIYPGRFLELLETLQEATSLEENSLQILLTSHSPTVINAFKDKPRALVFVDMVSRSGERVTRARQIQEKPADRGATSISRQEVEHILETSQPGGVF